MESKNKSEIWTLNFLDKQTDERGEIISTYVWMYVPQTRSGHWRVSSSEKVSFSSLRVKQKQRRRDLEVLLDLGFIQS